MQIKWVLIWQIRLRQNGSHIALLKFIIKKKEQEERHVVYMRHHQNVIYLKRQTIMQHKMVILQCEI
jgi:hypothetical protein